MVGMTTDAVTPDFPRNSPPGANMQDVVTLTLNPSVDVSLAVDTVLPVHKLRCSAGAWHPGGGGINVARVAHRLGSKALALYPCGGVMGQELQVLLNAEDLPQQTIPIAAETRQNFSVHETTLGQDYRFVLPGPSLTPTELKACLEAFLDRLPGASHAVVSGSLPSGVPEHCYADLCRRAQARGYRIVLDASGPALALALREGVELVKPSLRELADLVGRPLEEETQWRAAAASLVEQGQARIVALSLGEDGALVVTRHGHWHARAVPVEVRSTIGAGDSFLGGWLHGWPSNSGPSDDEHAVLPAFRWAMATAASAVSSHGTALSNPAQVRALLDRVVIERL
jgi:6-phosphofructokinase 2